MVMAGKGSEPVSLSVSIRRRSQVVRQRSAKPLFVGSIPTAALIESNSYGQPVGCPFAFESLLSHSFQGTVFIIHLFTAQVGF